jgi:hypothetical protein
MAIDFPNSPSVNDTYVVDGRTWVWTGSVWNIIGQGGPTGPTGPAGDWTTAQTVETKTAAYTIASTDAGKVIRMNATADFTVDSTTGFSTGQKVDIIRIAAGACGVVQGSGATVNGTPGLELRAQYSAASILCVATDTYYVIGDLSA